MANNQITLTWVRLTVDTAGVIVKSLLDQRISIYMKNVVTYRYWRRCIRAVRASIHLWVTKRMVLRCRQAKSWNCIGRWVQIPLLLVHTKKSFGVLV